jgi:L-asparaginase
VRIKVFFTGGTIGSQNNNSILNVAKEANPLLFTLYRNQRPDCEIEFSSETLFSVLSENMTLSNWKQMYDRVSSISDKDCDGIIITHGTDTLAYTANFLSFMLTPHKVPILLVSSVRPLDDPRSNGVHNFTAAVDFISKVKTKGIFVPFWKTKGATIIHLGTRVLQAQPFVHCFSSLGNVAYGKMVNGVFERYCSENNPLPEDIECPSLIKIPYFPEERKILYLKAYPTFNYNILDFKEKPDAIIHGLFHSGTACASPQDERYSIISFARRCIDQGIDFYVAPYEERDTMYDSSNLLHESGIKFICNMSCVSAYTKLIIAYGSFTDKEIRQEFIDTNIACEKYC